MDEVRTINCAMEEECVAMYRVVLHDQGEPWYGLHEVKYGDDGRVTSWDRDAAGFKCEASDGEDGIAQLLMAAAGDAGRWPVVKESELP